MPALDYLPATNRAFSGLHVPIRGGGNWPHDVEKWFYTGEHEFAFDNLIYIPGTKYANEPVAFVMILAHEFQHFVQYGESEMAWKVHDILFRNVGKFDLTAMVWDIPDERDAMLVSKRVTEDEFGTQAVQELMEREIADANSNGNFSKREVWTFLSSLSSAVGYNWREETGRVVEKYRPHLEASLSHEEMGLLNTWVQLRCNSPSGRVAGTLADEN